MRFKIGEKVFEALPEVCFGVVVAKGIDNRRGYSQIAAMLADSLTLTEKRFQDKKVKEDPAILPYRDAFTKLGMNPNKFMSSIEAMFTRVSKGKGLPSINPIVDLGNALSLQYILPMGAHDIDQMDADMEVRFSRPEDRFIPFGETGEETVEENELVYVVGNKVRTRRWIWRQSELGKIGEASSNIFFPIDGFASANKEAILAAREELANLCGSVFALADVRVDFLDAGHREMEL